MKALAARPAVVVRKWRRECMRGVMDGGLVWVLGAVNVGGKRMLQWVATWFRELNPGGNVGRVRCPRSSMDGTRVSIFDV